jgi:nucleoside-diphosphate kinase
MSKTLVIFKPDCYARRLEFELMARISSRGYQLIKWKCITSNSEYCDLREVVEKHYEEHKGKHFYQKNNDFVSEGPLHVMVWQGKDVIPGMRNLLTVIRKELVSDTTKNLIHASDSQESAAKEIALWFPSDIDIMNETNQKCFMNGIPILWKKMGELSYYQFRGTFKDIKELHSNLRNKKMKETILATVERIGRENEESYCIYFTPEDSRYGDE